ncbi:MAG: phosphoenolpyruvate carboxykinase [Actinomycetota bacterium]|nr:phosphoenolpyruvate carboxykinase [Actinomycetota bacterium]MDH5223413.1 phosphoenolpyruvate carboxykinase [Actinomycetota bacterium]MDH5312273.1 phosphoenolpyruvate carboxykinase [Actinomycetota bacterium]
MAEVLVNPTPEELRTFTEEMPETRISEYGNTNTQTTVLSRSAASTYVVGRESSGKTMTRQDYDAIAATQDAYIAEHDMIQIDGYIGNDPAMRTAARLLMEKRYANIAGMQQKLYFDRNDGAQPQVQVIYTPGLDAPGYPDDRVIAVDLDNYVTRVLNSDYFGESKKGGLRMWNDIVYNKGGLALHAGLKVIPTAHGDKVFMIIGLSGTGKTTTTFTTQNGSLPIQDDFVGLMPGGHAYGTENGCFAKTFGLDPDFEPSIHGAVVKPTAYLENVSMTDDGTVDFFNEHYTKNGRAVFEMSDLMTFGDARDVGPVDYLLILNRNENIIPAVSKLDLEQAAAFFMLGETTGTAAGGAAEEGKFLRVPGTNPFFPLPHGLQGNRLLELLATHPIETYLLNTGRVGGKDGDDRSKKLRIPDTSACVKGIAEQTIEFDEDPDFGYQVATSVPDLDDEERLRPRTLYERQGRGDDYAQIVERLKTERVAHLQQFTELSEEIIKAVG